MAAPEMLIAAALALSLVAAQSGDHHVPDFAHVRTASPPLQKALDHGRLHSATFAALLARLDRTDVVVYVELSRRVPRHHGGHLHFIAAAGGHRYLRIRLPRMMSRAELIASLAHELRHAIEIGEHRVVQCERTLRGLYEQIGKEHARNEFETTDAIQAGQAVRSEILAP